VEFFVQFVGDKIYLSISIARKMYNVKESYFLHT